MARRRLAPGFRIGASFQLRFDATGTMLVTLGQRIALWDVATRQKVAKGPPFANATSVDFSPDGQLIAAKNSAGEILVLTVPGLAVHARLAPEVEGPAIRFAPDGRLVDGSWSGRLALRDAMSGAVTWEEPGDGVFSLACTRDRCAWVYTRAARRQPGRLIVRRWPFDVHEPEEVPLSPAGTDHAISADGRRLAVAAGGLTVLERGEAGGWRKAASIAELPASGTADGLSWSPDGEFLAHSARAGVVYDRTLRTLHAEPLEYPCDAEVSPSGELVAFGGWGAGIVIAWPPPPADRSPQRGFNRPSRRRA